MTAIVVARRVEMVGVDWESSWRRRAGLAAGLDVLEASSGSAADASGDVAAALRQGVLAAGVQLARALREGDRHAARAAAGRLAGRGEGLTPAGDDWLVGAFHALWAGAHPLRDQAPALAELAAARTTALSAAWLRAAAAGRASPPWARLLAALAAGHSAAVITATTAVAATGHSSGRCSLRGFVTTVRALQTKNPRHLHSHPAINSLSR